MPPTTEANRAHTDVAESKPFRASATPQTQGGAPGPCGWNQPRTEAISLPDMVQAVCTEMGPLFEHHQITPLLNGDTRGLPWVVGQRTPLRAALWECVEAVVVHARLGVEAHRSLAIEMRFATDANQVHLTLRSLGAIEVVTLTASGSAAPEDTDHRGASTGLAEPRQHVVFPFARVLLQHLGGQVVVQHSADGGMACTLSLPCVTPEMAAAAPGKHHAQIYAGLLTRLTQTGPLAGQHHPF